VFKTLRNTHSLQWAQGQMVYKMVYKLSLKPLQYIGIVHSRSSSPKNKNFCHYILFI